MDDLAKRLRKTRADKTLEPEVRRVLLEAAVAIEDWRSAHRDAAWKALDALSGAIELAPLDLPSSERKDGTPAEEADALAEATITTALAAKDEIEMLRDRLPTWRDLASAPRDGTEFIVFWREQLAGLDRIHTIVRVAHFQRDKLCDTYDRLLPDVNGWMPLERVAL